MTDSRPRTASSTSRSTVVEHQVQPNDKKFDVDPFLVSLDPDSPKLPLNWSKLYKWYLTMTSGLLVMNATFASSAPSTVMPELIKELHMSREVAILTISLFVAGYCVGPLLWGPLSEQYGRRPVFIASFVVYTAFQVGCALSQNAATMIVLRFISGAFAASPLTNSGGVISDIWDARARGKALAMFTLAPFAGPTLGPTVAGYIAVSGTSWRWVFWVLTIFAGVCLIQIVFTLPETYLPALLVQEAKRLRKETGDERYYAPLERQNLTLTHRIEQTLTKPFKMLAYEPMLLAITVYMSFVYGCIYLLFEAYPIVFSVGHGFGPGALGLTFLPILVGGALGVVGYFAIFNPRYVKAVEQYAPAPVPPERRLEMALFSAPAFCIAFFWFGWTSFPSVTYWAPMLAGGLIGLSVIWIFLPLFNYMIDTYLFAAASALAANTVIRSIFGAVFPLFATQMYEGLGARWASSLLGFVALAMVPIPFVLIKFGPTLRAKSRFAPQLPPPPVKPVNVTSDKDVGAESV